VSFHAEISEIEMKFSAYWLLCPKPLSLSMKKHFIL